MSKLIYPEEGIYRYCSENIELCSNKLKNAYNNCNFDVPNDFSYKGFLDSLGSNINGFISENNNIDSILKKINYNYEVLSEELNDRAKKLETIKIVERDRMIY